MEFVESWVGCREYLLAKALACLGQELIRERAKCTGIPV